MPVPGLPAKRTTAPRGNPPLRSRSRPWIPEGTISTCRVEAFKSSMRSLVFMTLPLASLYVSPLGLPLVASGAYTRLGILNLRIVYVGLLCGQVYGAKYRVSCFRGLALAAASWGYFSSVPGYISITSYCCGCSIGWLTMAGEARKASILAVMSITMYLDAIRVCP